MPLHHFVALCSYVAYVVQVVLRIARWSYSVTTAAMKKNVKKEIKVKVEKENEKLKKDTIRFSGTVSFIGGKVMFKPLVEFTALELGKVRRAYIKSSEEMIEDMIAASVEALSSGLDAAEVESLRRVGEELVDKTKTLYIADFLSERLLV